MDLKFPNYSISRLLTEDPHQRLGARGASEVILVLNISSTFGCSIFLLIALYFWVYFFLNFLSMFESLGRLFVWNGFGVCIFSVF